MMDSIKYRLLNNSRNSIKKFGTTYGILNFIIKLLINISEVIRPPTCLVKMYDNVPPLSTISRRISFFLLNDSSEEAAKSTANWQLRNRSETCKVPMTRSNRNNIPNFHFAVFSSLYEFLLEVTWGNWALHRSSRNFLFSCTLLQKVVRPVRFRS